MENKKIVSIQDLIKNKEAIQERKNKLYDIEIPNFGIVTIKQPTMGLIAEATSMDENSDQYLIYESFVEPNLKDSTLLKEYACTEPTDIVNKIFKAGEIAFLSKAIMSSAGYGNELKFKVHDELKN